MRPLSSRIVALLGVVLATGCSPERPSQAAPPKAPAFAVLPIEMTVSQRSTNPVPGSDGNVLLTIDDVTKGQVMVSLGARSGAGIMTPYSMTLGASARFEVDGSSYFLTLKELKNALIGRDSATFVISATNAPPATEDAKIELLIEHVRHMKDATFIRNGAIHTPQEAADHLRTKWRAHASQIETAAQFIDRVASRSSLSGDAYEIRSGDGRIVRLADDLRARLADIDRGR